MGDENALGQAHRGRTWHELGPIPGQLLVPVSQADRKGARAIDRKIPEGLLEIAERPVLLSFRFEEGLHQLGRGDAQPQIFEADLAPIVAQSDVQSFAAAGHGRLDHFGYPTVRSRQLIGAEFLTGLVSIPAKLPRRFQPGFVQLLVQRLLKRALPVHLFRWFVHAGCFYTGASQSFPPMH